MMSLGRYLILCMLFTLPLILVACSNNIKDNTEDNSLEEINPNYINQEYDFGLLIPDELYENMTIEVLDDFTWDSEISQAHANSDLGIKVITFTYHGVSESGSIPWSHILFTIKVCPTKLYEGFTNPLYDSIITEDYYSTSLLHETEENVYIFAASPERIENMAVEIFYNEHKEEILAIANSFTTVKEYILANFGEESLANYEKYTKESAERKTIEISKTIPLTGDVKIDATNILASSIEGFDANNYKQVVTEGANKGDYIIHYLELVNGCETASGYCAIVTSNTVEVIYDNTIPIDAELSSDLTSKPIMTKDMIEKAYTEAASQYKKYEVASQSGKLFYDIEEGYTAYRVKTEYCLRDGTFFVDIYDYVIK